FYSEKEAFIKELAVLNFIGGTPMVIVKKTSFIDSGGFDVTLDALEDYELWLRMASNDYKFMRITKALTLCYYTTSNTSVSKNIENNLSAFEL
ncbi:hypothetical protein ACJBS4_11740, partial [Streptococcus suis]